MGQRTKGLVRYNKATDTFYEKFAVKAAGGGSQRYKRSLGRCDGLGADGSALTGFAAREKEANRKAGVILRALEREQELLGLEASGIIPKSEVRDGEREVTLFDATARYMQDHGCRRKSAPYMVRRNLVILAWFGTARLLSTIDKPLIAEFRAWLMRQPSGFDVVAALRDLGRPITDPTLKAEIEQRHAKLPPRHSRAVMEVGTLNNYLRHLRAVLLWSEEQLGAKVRHFKWGGRGGRTLIGKEKASPQRIIESFAEEAALIAALGRDAGDVLIFGLDTAQREMNLLSLTKAQVHWQTRWATGTLLFHIKSPDVPGGIPHEVAITPRMAAILEARWHDHPSLVFTYECRLNHVYEQPDGSRLVHRRGARYPWRQDRFIAVFTQAVRRLGIAGMSFHRAGRATAITRIATAGDIQEAMLLSGHLSQATAMRYNKKNKTHLAATLAKLDLARAAEASNPRPTAAPPDLKIVGGTGG